MTSQDLITNALKKCGPSRTSHLIDELVQSLNITQQAARQRLSRSLPPIQRMEGSLLPRGESFFYLPDQYRTERFWTNLLRDLRATGSVYACAIDGLNARGGVVPINEFHTVSGAPIALKKQVCSSKIEQTLMELRIMDKKDVIGLGACYVANQDAIMMPVDIRRIKARRLAERYLLDVLRQWLRTNRLGSFHKIAVRGEDHPLKVGQFQWDLTGPCYLHCLKTSKVAHGFVAADVFAEGILDAHHVRYFTRKVQTYQRTSNSGGVLPILLGERFTAEALKEGGIAGLMLVTPDSLFGKHVAEALTRLIQTVVHVAYVVANDPEQLFEMIDAVSNIEGRSLNLRGIMFELLSVYIAGRIFDGLVDIGITHTNTKTGEKAEMDVILKSHDAALVIECKGLSPNGQVTIDDVNQWIGRLPTMQDFIAREFGSREYSATYELWTSGTFENDALKRLQKEKENRSRHPIDFKDGTAIRSIAIKKRLKRVVDALDEHFLRHPLANYKIDVPYDGTNNWKIPRGHLPPTQKQLDCIAELREVIASLSDKKVRRPGLKKNANRATASEYIKELIVIREKILNVLL